jgi:hypothetical protein
VASGLPKPQELTVAAGSTYLIQIQDYPERVHGDTSLRTLGAEGLGLRRHEGFGDLAPPPLLRPGKAHHDAKATRLREVTDRTAPLQGLPVQVSAQTWRVLLTLMGSHANGDTQTAAQRLRRFSAGQPDTAIREAMAFFLGLPPEDARHVVEGLSR